MSDTPPQDQEARDDVRERLGDTLFVEAGAGSGKTTVLVDRVSALVESGVDIASIAAITFTEKAAAELRIRVREELEDRPSSPLIDAALASLGDAPMSTLHAFARRVLTEHGLAVAIPPRFEVLDDVGEAIEFEQRWRALAVRLFSPGDPLTPAVERAVELGLTPRHLKEIVSALHQSYDRLRGAAIRPEWPSDPVRPARVDITPFLDELRLLDIGDESLADYLQRAEAAETDAARIDIARTEGVMPRYGANAAKRALKNVLAELRRAALTALVPALAATVLEWSDDRKRDGRLTFHDLLVLARDALRVDEVRAACRLRYERILIDEFQDTDPLQIELAVLLASSHPHAGELPWDGDALLPGDEGRLFFVGDPKQSIYRFRRADIDLYRNAQQVFADSPLHLTENFRTVASIVNFVNGLFQPWMEASKGAQADYVALTPHVPDHQVEPCVMAIGDEVADVSTAEVRALEAEDVARVVAQAKREAWQVRGERGVLRPAQYSDIAVLMPTRASLPALDHRLDAAGIPARVESRTLIWNTAEVRDLLAVLSAITDPNDQVAIVAALRSPGLACSDLDLATWRWGDGRWSYFATTGPGPTHPVGAAMTKLRELHRARWELSIGEMVRRVIDVCHVREIAFAHVRPRDRWRRVDFFLAQAREFEAAGGASIDEFVAWAREQSEREVWVNDSIAPDPDDDAVRILTVHASKGLEFPIVVLMGLNVQYQSVGPAVLWGDGGPEAKAGSESSNSRFETANYADLWKDEKAAFEAERVRLAYVAMTRARDHLVVSLFRPAKGKTLAHEVVRHAPALEVLETMALEPAGETQPALPTPPTLGARDEWIATRSALIDRLGRSPAVAATRVQHLVPAVVESADAEPDGSEGAGGQEGEDGLDVATSAVEAADTGEDQPPWRRGRAGTAIGRAVHAVLQTVDLATGEGADTLSVAQAAAEGVPALATEIERRVRHVLESPSVKAAVATGRYWREVFLAAPVEGRVLEGFIDLLYEDAAGDLVVVDYKTDGVRNEEQADEAVARYRLQGAAYALAVASSLNRPVSRCVFVFANPTRWFERELPDLEAACREVAGLVASA